MVGLGGLHVLRLVVEEESKAPEDRLRSLIFTTRACKADETDPLQCQTVLTLSLQQGAQQRAAAKSQKPQ